MEVGLASKPEVIRIGRILGLSPEAVCGWLLKFWGWIDANSVDGVVDGVVDGDVDMVIALPGLASALESVKWLEFDAERRRMVVPNFDRHNGESSKKRALKNRRQARWRDGVVDGDASQKTSTREEKKREDIKDLSTSLRSVDSVIAVLPEKQKTTTLATITSPPLPKKPNTELNRLIWDAYSAEYLKAYGTEPIRNAQSNGVIAKIGKRLPAAAAPQVAAFYLSVKQPFYVRTRHSLPNLLRDCEALHTQWITGRKATTLEARSAEHVDNVTEQIKRVGARLENRHETA